MTVRDAINKTEFSYGDVEYRTNSFIQGKENDIWMGTVLYDGETLVPYDHDTYSLDDEIVEYEYVDNGEDPYLIVWYESKWIMSGANERTLKLPRPKMIDKIRQMSVEEMAEFLVVLGSGTDIDYDWDENAIEVPTTVWYTPFGEFDGYLDEEDVVKEVIRYLLSEEKPDET